MKHSRYMLVEWESGDDDAETVYRRLEHAREELTEFLCWHSKVQVPSITSGPGEQALVGLRPDEVAYLERTITDHSFITGEDTPREKRCGCGHLETLHAFMWDNEGGHGECLVCGGEC